MLIRESEFRALAEAVESRLGDGVAGLRAGLGELRDAIETELSRE
jgi:hypothetical protein